MTVALVNRVGFDVDAIDVFCGFGGSSQGIHASGATVLAAANHNALSIECHAKNFPDTDHWLADLVDTDAKNYLDPADLPAARFAWFSPSCTHHSQANATKVYERGLQLAIDEDDDWDEQAYVNSERSRVTMSCVLRYAAAHHPEILVVENVIEVTKWGPGKDGSTFRWWMRELDHLGYETRPLFLNSMFFAPCPQSRDRIYVVAWRKGNQAPALDYRPPAFCTSDRCGGRLVDAVQTWKTPTRAWLGMAQWGKYPKHGTGPVVGRRAASGQNNFDGSGLPRVNALRRTIGWTDCGHDSYRPGVVLDPFSGTGTTGLAARMLGRRYVGIDIDPASHDQAVERFKQGVLTGGAA